MMNNNGDDFMTTHELKIQVRNGQRYLDISSRSKLNDIIYFVGQLLKADGDNVGYAHVAELQNKVDSDYFPIEEILNEHIWD